MKKKKKIKSEKEISKNMRQQARGRREDLGAAGR